MRYIFCLLILMGCKQEPVPVEANNSGAEVSYVHGGTSYKVFGKTTSDQVPGVVITRIFQSSGPYYLKFIDSIGPVRKVIIPLTFQTPYPSTYTFSSTYILSDATSPTTFYRGNGFSVGITKISDKKATGVFHFNLPASLSPSQFLDVTGTFKDVPIEE